MSCLRCATPAKCDIWGCSPGTWPSENPPMAQSNKERQEALRARRLMLGMTEVRGIYLHPDQHAELKAFAKKLAKRLEAESRKSPAENGDPCS